MSEHDDDQLTRTDVRQMYAEGRYAEILRARADGRLDDLLNTTTDRKES